MKVSIPLNPANKLLLIFFIKLFIIYIILNFCYDGYVGLIDPQGSYNFSETLGKFNLIEYITKATTYPVSWILNLIGYNAYRYGNVVGIQDYKGIRILFPCLGIKMWIAFFSLIAAYPTNRSWKTVSLFIVIGIAIIHFFNIIRMFLLTLTNRYYKSDAMHAKIFQIHHDVFNLVVGIVVIAMFYIWVKKFNHSTPII